MSLLEEEVLFEVLVQFEEAVLRSFLLRLFFLFLEVLVPLESAKYTY